jgi:hypothetical protein
MIDELRATLADRAERVTPRPDPYLRLLRRRQRRRQTVAGVASVLALAILLPGGWLLTHGGAGHLGNGGQPDFATPPPLLARLLDSPIRGSLAGDTDFLNRMRQRAADDAGPVPDDGGDGRTPAAGAMPGPVRQRVLFAGDVPGGQRLVLITGNDPDPVVMLYHGGVGASATDLRPAGSAELAPVLNLSWNGAAQEGADGPSYDIVLGPAGSQLQVGTDPRYLTDGTVRRIWTPEPGDFLVRPADGLPLRTRVRVSLAGTLLYEGGLTSPLPSGGRVPIDPNPVDGGTAEPVVAQQVADTIADTTGLIPAMADFTVRWSAEIPMAGLTDSKTAIIATVLARTRDGGGVYYTMSVDPAQPDASARDHPTGGGVLGDPDHSLIAMRLPYYSGTGPTDQLQIIAPPAATRVDALANGKVLASGNLSRGAGQLRLALPTSATIRAYGAAGTLIAERNFVDNEGLRTDLYEPQTKAW